MLNNKFVQRLVLVSVGAGIGYLKCLSQVAEKYGDQMSDKTIELKPFKHLKHFKVSITNHTKKEES